MIIIVAWIESDTDKIKIKIELYSLRSSDLLCQEWIVAIYKTDTIARLQISFILLQNTYSVQYTIYIRVRTHARVYMRVYICVCTYNAASDVYVAKYLYVVSWLEWIQRCFAFIVEFPKVSVFLCEYCYLMWNRHIYRT